jgi:tRNA threonylcarbamoyl adenosine modification protein (Sua5/YciO/YrdC/YwlC family)
VAVHDTVSVGDAEALEAAVRALRAERVIVLPTDTVYGLAAMPGSPRAVDDLYELKDRPSSMPIAMLVASREQVSTLAEPVSPRAGRLMEAFWPGPLTIVLAAREGQRQATVGVRCPDHDFVRALARRVGPLAVTSANRHGELPPASALDAARSLTGEVALVIDGGPCDGLASTVVDATDPSLPVLREGSIRRERIAAVALR